MAVSLTQPESYIPLDMVTRVIPTFVTRVDDLVALRSINRQVRRVIPPPTADWMGDRYRALMRSPLGVHEPYLVAEYVLAICRARKELSALDQMRQAWVLMWRLMRYTAGYIFEGLTVPPRMDQVIERSTPSPCPSRT